MSSNDFQYFTCKVGIEDSFHNTSKKHRFEVRFYRDEELKTNWFADHQHDYRSAHLCDIAIPKNCTHVELIVTCEGDSPGAVIWFEPLLSNQRPSLGEEEELSKERAMKKNSTPNFQKAYDCVLSPLVELVRLYEKWDEPLSNEGSIENDNTMLSGNGGIELPYCLEPTQRCVLVRVIFFFLLFLFHTYTYTPNILTRHTPGTREDY